MSDKEENKPKKLTLGGSKLSLKKPIDSTKIKQDLLTSKTKTLTVNVKGKTAQSGVASKLSMPAKKEISGSEVDSRLKLLKRAAETEKQEEQRRQEIKRKAEAHFASIKTEEPVIEEPVIEEPKAAAEVKDEAPKLSPSPSSSPSPSASESTKVEKKVGAPAKKPAPIAPVNKKPEEKKEEEKVPVKPKTSEPKKMKKSDIFTLLGEDEGASKPKTRSLASIKRAREKERRKQAEATPAEKVYREVTIPEAITVGDLANRMSERAADVVRELMKLGVMATATQTIDADTAEIAVEAFGHTSKRVQESDVESIIHKVNDAPSDLLPRAPVVTVMGHVDHGKTSLLDALKATDIVAGEAGGITQHIGAYRVKLPSGSHITFLDTPGHEAFTEMRTRGAKVTDIVILVVAADDGIKTQTIEAINHAKAAEVPIIVAINKIDKPGADITRVKNELLQHELVPEELGGDIIVTEVSALKRTNLDKLEENVLLMAEMMELKANPNAPASGHVVEARIDRSRGSLATILVERGTLREGDLVVAGCAYGRVKRMINDKATSIKSAGPSVPIEVLGLNQAPLAGDEFAVVETERQARDITEYRDRKIKDKQAATVRKGTMDDLFSRAAGNAKTKDLNLIIKADVQGSIEAIRGSLDKFKNDEVNINILHSAVGGITESDVTLAGASNAMVIGFNVRASGDTESKASNAAVKIFYYSIIYNLIDDVKGIVSGMMSPLIREEYIGSVEIREVFNITKVGKIAGSYVTKGFIKRGSGMRLIRDDIVIHEGKLKTLKRFKDDVKEVAENYECGIAFEKFEDIKVGDRVEVFELIEEQKQL